ncbi:MAG: TetR/AcrR family transcriptional regulator [Parvibaculum sp.]|uniref:TetR/AcrR family transcriptional regulator n=1 Tax=Parvibaculum sp. TaxID=2024848 RepID=UPI00272FB8D1|nr:TetR/AcrR family transcriptional regulator [Parvibaculum sp.]MDP2151692.1 TetR/AcrR family transcriptional regulator [Parvibaculum sp.]
MSLDTHRRNVSDKKRTAILKAALDNFLRNGFSRAGMAEIAREADVSTATLYKHFDSKETLFAAVVKRASQSVGDYSGILEPGDTVRDILRKLSKAYLTVQFDHKANALMRIVIAEVPGAPKLATEMYEVLANRRNDTLMAVMDAMIERGMLKPHDAAFSTRLGAGMLKELFVWPALFDADYKLPPDTDKKIEVLADVFLELYGA